MKKKRFFKFVFRVFIGLFAIVLMITLPFLGLRVSDDFSFISSKFVGSKSKYQGVIEVWNIDTFESGTNPKINYLNSVAQSFQKQNKGLYILVRNLTEYECLNLLSQGIKPDIFSCSYGISNKIKEYVEPFSNADNLGVRDELIQAGMYENKLYALAWCFGVYCFISTDSHLSKAKVNLDEKIKLSDLSLSLGYELKLKNGTKIISSLSYGSNKYLLPKEAFLSYTNKELIVNSDYSLDKESNNQSQYTAYSKFIAGESVVLLGTQRDIARMENRLKNGKVSKVYYDYINTFTDLIQFSFLAKNDDLIKLEYCEKFAKFLTLNKNQKKISEIGMMPVTGQVDVYNSGIMLDITLNLLGFTGLKRVFYEK